MSSGRHLTVLAVLGLLAGCDWRSIQERYDRRLYRAQVARAKADITMLATALDQYAMANAGKWPDSLEALVLEDAEGYAYLRVRQIPLDPWENDYQYEPPGAGSMKYRLYSLGSDSAVGGVDEGRDITYQAILNNEL